MPLFCKVPAHIQSNQSTEVAKQFLYDAADYNVNNDEGCALEDFNPVVPEGFIVEKDDQAGSIKLRDQAGWVIAVCTEF